jgi:hypothetical protein
MAGRRRTGSLRTFIPCLTLNFSVKRRCAWFPASRECFRDVRRGKDKLPHLKSPRFLLRRDHPQPLHLLNWLRIGPIVYILSIPRKFSTYILHNVPDSTSLSAIVRAEPASQSTIGRDQKTPPLSWRSFCRYSLLPAWLNLEARLRLSPLRLQFP